MPTRGLCVRTRNQTDNRHIQIAREVTDLDQERVDDVVLEELEVRVAEPVLDVLPAPREQVVQHVHHVALPINHTATRGGISEGRA